MLKSTVSGIALTLLLIGMLALAFSIQPVKASGTIYIRADGSIDPPDVPILTLDNVTYTLTGNITTDGDGIVVEKDNIVIDGAGYMLQGTVVYPYTGIRLSGRENVTVRNVQIKNFNYGICLERYGFMGTGSSNNSISGNNITSNRFGIYLSGGSNNNKIYGNNVTNNNYGVFFDYTTENNTVHGNNIVSNELGICLDGYISATYKECPENNIICENNIVDNMKAGVKLLGLDNIFCHNNFLNNTIVIGSEFSSGGTNDPKLSKNILDDGYPSGGNYWSDYSGVDLYTGPSQNLTEGIGSDGIGDTNYTIDGNNVDRYPLTIPWINKTPLHPLEGQYANYAALSVIHGSIVDSLHFNLTYHKYVSPFLMYVMMRDDHTPTISYWTALNITNRYSYHCVWPITGIVADLWFPYWIETDITIGSTVNLLNGTATVVNSRILHIEPRSAKCWELVHDEEIGPSTYIHHTFWFHKTTGLLIGEEVEVSSYQKFNITLVKSNILLGYEIVAVYGSTPTIDGTINVNEWSDAASVSFNNTEVFVKQDGKNFYVAFNVLNAPFHEQDAIGLYVDAENDGNPSSQPPDIIMGIYRNGTLVEGNLTEGTVTQTNVTLWTASFHSDSNMWQAEFSIAYSKIGVVAGVEKTLGIIFVSGSGGLPYPFTWPPEDQWDLQNDPSLWGKMISTGYDWIPEFPSLLIPSLFMTATLLTVIVHKKRGIKNRKTDSDDST